LKSSPILRCFPSRPALEVLWLISLPLGRGGWFPGRWRAGEALGPRDLAIATSTSHQLVRVPAHPGSCRWPGFLRQGALRFLEPRTSSPCQQCRKWECGRRGPARLRCRRRSAAKRLARQRVRASTLGCRVMSSPSRVTGTFPRRPPERSPGAGTPDAYDWRTRARASASERSTPKRELAAGVAEGRGLHRPGAHRQPASVGAELVEQPMSGSRRRRCGCATGTAPQGLQLVLPADRTAPGYRWSTRQGAQSLRHRLPGLGTESRMAAVMDGG